MFDGVLARAEVFEGCVALRGCSLEVGVAVRYPHERGCTWNARACGGAVPAHELNGCLWGAGPYRRAANGVHLEVLRYLHENECPWDDVLSSLSGCG